MHTSSTIPLPVFIEDAPQLADFLQVKKVTLIRDDYLPDFGGKKRRSLQSFADKIPANIKIHVFSYEGSHTAFTLSKVLPNNQIILYGKTYPGGTYRRFMSKQLDKRRNVVQLKGNLFTLAITYFLARLSNRNDYFMKTGGAVGDDRAYKMAAAEVRNKIGDNAIHVVAVASGDLLQALKSSFTNVVGILTQPWYLKLIQRIRLTGTRGITGSSIQNRERLVFHIYQKTGLAFDPVFMGSVLEYIIRKGRDLDHVCLWVTCPSIVSDYLQEQLGQ